MTIFRVENISKIKIVYERICNFEEFEIYKTIDKRAQYEFLAVRDGIPNVQKKKKILCSTLNGLIAKIVEFKNKDILK